MLKGSFGKASGRPFIESKIDFPRLQISGTVKLLVDTGADNCILMPADCDMLGIDWSQLRGGQNVFGVGGSSKTYREPAVLMFEDDDNRLHSYSTPLAIMAPAPTQLPQMPSLLGRDILSRWKMTYDPIFEILTFEVHSADQTLQP
jgi:hypothetical protein